LIYFSHELKFKGVGIMKSKLFVFLLILFVSVFIGCNEENALSPTEDVSQITTTLEKPSSNLIGTTYCPFTLTPPTFWNGTVDFGPQGVYGLTFISLTSKGHSQASHFEEDFVIYELGTDWTDPANVYMKGHHEGVVIFANKLPEPSKFHANGKIEEAYGAFADWQGRRTHMKGLVYWVTEELPDRAEGTLRIN
jgi:hypothetical protein